MINKSNIFDIILDIRFVLLKKIYIYLLTVTNEVIKYLFDGVILCRIEMLSKSSRIIAEVMVLWSKQNDVPAGKVYRQFSTVVRKIRNLEWFGELQAMFVCRSVFADRSFYDRLKREIEIEDLYFPVVKVIEAWLSRDVKFYFLLELLRALSSRLKVKTVYISFASDVTTDEKKRLTDLLYEMHDYKLDTYLETNSNLISGWVGVFDFLKADRSVLGAVNSLVDNVG